MAAPDRPADGHLGPPRTSSSSTRSSSTPPAACGGRVPGQGPRDDAVRGRREGRHPVLYVVTDNNMLSDAGRGRRAWRSPHPFALDGVVARGGDGRGALDLTRLRRGGEARRPGRRRRDAGIEADPDPRRFACLEGLRQRDATRGSRSRSRSAAPGAGFPGTRRTRAGRPSGWRAAAASAGGGGAPAEAAVASARPAAAGPHAAAAPRRGAAAGRHRLRAGRPRQPPLRHRRRRSARAEPLQLERRARLAPDGPPLELPVPPR